jgi:sigma54-dependent transcription regulator
MPFELIGASPAFRRVLDDIRMVGPVDSAVLVQGETGTGKELIAQAIHEASPRRHQRFVAAPSRRSSDDFRRLTAVRCFLTKSRIFPSNCSRNYSGSSRNSRSSASEAGTQ